MNLTLRARIALTTATVTALALILLAAGSWAYIYLEELAAIDEHLEGESLELRADLASGEIDSDEFSHDEFEPKLGFAVFTPQGKTIGITPSFPLEVAAAQSSRDGFRFGSLGDSRWRIYDSNTPDYTVSVSHNLEEFDDILFDFAISQTILIPLVTALSAWLSWILAGRSLRPIQRATLIASQIGGGDLTNRLPVGPIDDEVGQFTTVLNRMLDRIEKNYQQAKRFAGDASHELGTPLTIIKGELENLLDQNNLAPVAEQRVLSALQEVDRMHQIIDQLLLLARFDAGKASSDHAPLNLSQLLHELAEDVDLLCAKPRIKITGHIAPAIQVIGDHSQLRRLFLNLFSNAVKYNVPSGTLEYRLSGDPPHLRFEISNTGHRIVPDDTEKIFERFFQTDSSHSQRGSGLGLSLCREIAQAHGGDIELESSDGQQTKFVVTLPLHEST